MIDMEALGGWDVVKGAIQRKWGDLTDDDFVTLKGNVRELAGRLQERYGMAIADARAQSDAFIDDLEHRAGPFYRRTRETVRTAAGAVDDAVHRFPWETVGVTFLLGAIVGFVVGNENRR